MLGVWPGVTSTSQKSRKDRSKSEKTNSTLLSVNTVATRLDGQHPLPGQPEQPQQDLRVVCHHHPDQPNVLSEKTSDEPTQLALPVEFRHHTAHPATAVDISGHGEGTDHHSGGVGCDVRTVSLHFSGNRPGHKKSTTKTKSVSSESCKEGGACLRDACAFAEGAVCLLGHQKLAGKNAMGYSTAEGGGESRGIKPNNAIQNENPFI